MEEKILLRYFINNGLLATLSATFFSRCMDLESLPVTDEFLKYKTEAEEQKRTILEHIYKNGLVGKVIELDIRGVWRHKFKGVIQFSNGVEVSFDYIEDLNFIFRSVDEIYKNCYSITDPKDSEIPILKAAEILSQTYSPDWTIEGKVAHNLLDEISFESGVFSREGENGKLHNVQEAYDVFHRNSIDIYNLSSLNFNSVTHRAIEKESKKLIFGRYFGYNSFLRFDEFCSGKVYEIERDTLATPTNFKDSEGNIIWSNDCIYLSYKTSIKEAEFLHKERYQHNYTVPLQQRGSRYTVKLPRLIIDGEEEKFEEVFLEYLIKDGYNVVATYRYEGQEYGHRAFVQTILPHML